MKGGDGMMNSPTNLQWFNTEGKTTGSQIDGVPASAPAQICLWASAKAYVSPAARGLHRNRVCQCVNLYACLREQPQFRCFLLPDEEGGGGMERRMPRKSPRCRVGHFDFSEEVVSRAHLSAPRWLFKVVFEIFISFSSLFVSKLLI